MVNLLGLPEGIAAPLDQRLTSLRQLPDATLHWYGKNPESPGRKLGHITVLLDGLTAEERSDQARMITAGIRDIWPLPSSGSD